MQSPKNWNIRDLFCPHLLAVVVPDLSVRRVMLRGDTDDSRVIICLCAVVEHNMPDILFVQVPLYWTDMPRTKSIKLAREHLP